MENLKVSLQKFQALSANLIAVSKAQPFQKIVEAYALGQRDFGENYVQEFVEKRERAQAEGLTEIRWHFLGHLQRNKVKAVLSGVYRIHSLDSLRLAEEVQKRASSSVQCLIQVNLHGEDAKSGVSFGEVEPLLESLQALDRVQVCGLMGIPSKSEPPKVAFSRLHELAKNLGLAEVSMGMSGDYQEAIQCGATWIRIGRGVFGERVP